MKLKLYQVALSALALVPVQSLAMAAQEKLQLLADIQRSRLLDERGGTPTAGLVADLVRRGLIPNSPEKDGPPEPSKRF